MMIDDQPLRHAVDTQWRMQWLSLPQVVSSQDGTRGNLSYWLVVRPNNGCFKMHERLPPTPRDDGTASHCRPSRISRF
jgi:hypothetical protein